jgi:hypothetical protein
VIRRPLPLPALLEIVDLIINITGAAFLSLTLFAIGENYSASFSSDLIPILSIF